MADLLSSIAQSAIGPAVSGGLNLLGGLIQQGGAQSSVMQQENFQQQMSNTAYQRATADMTKAGLNPALMYGSGGPESTPSGASMMPPNVMGGVTSSAMDAITTQKQLQVMDSQIAQNSASAQKTLADIPEANLEGHAAQTMDTLLSGVEKFLQGWGKHNANSSVVGNVFGGLQASAQNQNGPSWGDDLEAGLNPFSPSFMSSTWKGK